MPEAGGFVFAFLQQQLDVVEQKTAAIFERDFTHRTAGGQILRLRQNPRVPQHAAADEHAADAAAAHALEYLPGLDAVAAAEHRNAERFGHAIDQRPV